jgi:hypothetical protein
MFFGRAACMRACIRGCPRSACVAPPCTGRNKGSALHRTGAKARGADAVATYQSPRPALRPRLMPVVAAMPTAQRTALIAPYGSGLCAGVAPGSLPGRGPADTAVRWRSRHDGKRDHSGALGSHMSRLPQVTLRHDAMRWLVIPLTPPPPPPPPPPPATRAPWPAGRPISPGVRRSRGPPAASRRCPSWSR